MGGVAGQLTYVPSSYTLYQCTHVLMCVAASYVHVHANFNVVSDIPFRIQIQNHSYKYC